MEEPSIQSRREMELWLTIALRGVLAFLFGVVAISSPNMPLQRLAILFAGYLVLDGILCLYAAARAPEAHERRGLFAVEAGITVLAAIAVLLLPAANLIRIIAGLRAVLVGSSDAAWALRRPPRARLLMTGFGGITTIAFGVVLLGWPGSGVVALPWLLGVTALLSGAFWMGGGLTHLGYAAWPAGAEST